MFLRFMYRLHQFHSVHITNYFTFDLPHSKDEIPDLCELLPKIILVIKSRTRLVELVEIMGERGIEGLWVIEGNIKMYV
jgi:hypothetical protein